tara:strand:- start:2376 stop:2765 length:390 start_codon:yes stop_codon:yes gene_type:complete
VDNGGNRKEFKSTIKLITLKILISYMADGYRKGSKMEKTLDYLVREGLDCIKISGPKHRADGTTFLPVNIDDEKNYIDFLRNDMEGATFSNDSMLIELDFLEGNEIKKLNSKLKVENEKIYDVIRISYT